jgi:hypothetical protein
VKALTELETSAGLEKEWESEGVGRDGSQAHLREERKGVGRRGVGMGSDESVVGEDVWRGNVGEEGASVRQAVRGSGGARKQEASEIERVIVKAGLEEKSVQLVDCVHGRRLGLGTPGFLICIIPIRNYVDIYHISYMGGLQAVQKFHGIHNHSPIDWAKVVVSLGLRDWRASWKLKCYSM